jgi:hypothetical protein
LHQIASIKNYGKVLSQELADRQDPPKAAPPSGAESPTTVKPLEFDDEEEPANIKLEDHSAVPSGPAAHVVPGSGEDEAPPKPISKDLTPKEQAELTLKEAFPTIDKAVIRAVLIASGGKVEPAFNALLGTS